MITDAFTFLISTIFSLFISAVLLRIFLQLVRADFYNPFCQLIIRVTNFAIHPIRKIIPGYRGIDYSGVILAFLASALEIILLMLFSKFHFPNFFGMIIWSVANIVKLSLKIYLFAIIINSLLSFISPTFSPIQQVLFALTNPILDWIRRKVPLPAGVGSIDISPLLAIIGIIFLDLLVGNALMAWANYWLR